MKYLNYFQIGLDKWKEFNDLQTSIKTRFTIWKESLNTFEKGFSFDSHIANKTVIIILIY